MILLLSRLPSLPRFTQKSKEEPQKQPWGWWGVFADQDGNTYGVHQ